MKSSSLCPSPFFYIFSRRVELLEIWLGIISGLGFVLAWHRELWRVLAVWEGWECKRQVAVLISVLPVHHSSKPPRTPVKAFPLFQVVWETHCEEQQPCCAPRARGRCGSTGGCGSCPCCLARAVPCAAQCPHPSVRLSIRQDCPECE